MCEQRGNLSYPPQFRNTCFFWSSSLSTLPPAEKSPRWSPGVDLAHSWTQGCHFCRDELMDSTSKQFSICFCVSSRTRNRCSPKTAAGSSWRCRWNRGGVESFTTSPCSPRRWGAGKTCFALLKPAVCKFFSVMVCGAVERGWCRGRTRPARGTDAHYGSL